MSTSARPPIPPEGAAASTDAKAKGAISSPRVTQGAIASFATTLRQLLRYSLVSLLHSTIELLTFNLFVWLFSPRRAFALLLANTIAYALGAAASFAFNRRWTFDRRGRPTTGEIGRYIAAVLGGIAVSDALLWLLSRALLPVFGPTQLWANAAKLGAMAGTGLLSFLWMRLWVFARREPAAADRQRTFRLPPPTRPAGASATRAPTPSTAPTTDVRHTSPRVRRRGSSRGKAGRRWRAGERAIHRGAEKPK